MHTLISNCQEFFLRNSESENALHPITWESLFPRQFRPSNHGDMKTNISISAEGVRKNKNHRKKKQILDLDIVIMYGCCFCVCFFFVGEVL